MFTYALYLVPPSEILQVLFFVFTPLDLMSGVAVVLWGINVLLVRSLGLFRRTPPVAVHHVCWLIVAPRILEWC